jgi:hypothetical protein
MILLRTRPGCDFAARIPGHIVAIFGSATVSSASLVAAPGGYTTMLSRLAARVMPV